MTTEDDRQPFRIGLTGGIASGKSTVAELFAGLGIPVIDTDVIAREVVQPGRAAYNEIRARFGEDVIDAAGNLNRSIMRKLVFSNDEARLDLEAIVHPRIGAETRRQANVAAGPYQLIVVPLLVGSPLATFVDRVLVVDCDEELQIQRLLARDTETVAQARKILTAQASRRERLAIADDVIDNNDGIDKTRRQVLELDRRYRRLANGR